MVREESEKGDCFIAILQTLISPKGFQQQENMLGKTASNTLCSMSYFFGFYLIPTFHPKKWVQGNNYPSQ